MHSWPKYSNLGKSLGFFAHSHAINLTYLRSNTSQSNPCNTPNFHPPRFFSWEYALTMTIAPYNTILKANTTNGDSTDTSWSTVPANFPVHAAKAPRKPAVHAAVIDGPNFIGTMVTYEPSCAYLLHCADGAWMNCFGIWACMTKLEPPIMWFSSFIVLNRFLGFENYLEKHLGRFRLQQYFWRIHST